MAAAGYATALLLSGRLSAGCAWACGGQWKRARGRTCTKSGCTRFASVRTHRCCCVPKRRKLGPRASDGSVDCCTASSMDRDQSCCRSLARPGAARSDRCCAAGKGPEAGGCWFCNQCGACPILEHWLQNQQRGDEWPAARDGLVIVSFSSRTCRTPDTGAVQSQARPERGGWELANMSATRASHLRRGDALMQTRITLCARFGPGAAVAGFSMRGRRL